MGGDENETVLGGSFQRSTDDISRFGVKGGCGLIDEEQVSVCCNTSSNSDSLSLTSGQIATSRVRKVLYFKLLQGFARAAACFVDGMSSSESAQFDVCEGRALHQ